MECNRPEQVTLSPEKLRARALIPCPRPGCTYLKQTPLCIGPVQKKIGCWPAPRGIVFVFRLCFRSQGALGVPCHAFVWPAPSLHGVCADHAQPPIPVPNPGLARLAGPPVFCYPAWKRRFGVPWPCPQCNFVAFPYIYRGTMAMKIGGICSHNSALLLAQIFGRYGYSKICRRYPQLKSTADVPAARQPGRVGERVDVWMSRLWDGTGGLIRDYDFVRDYDTSAPPPLLPLAHGAPSVTGDLATTAPRNYGNSSRSTEGQSINFSSRNTAHIQPISPAARPDTQSRFHRDLQ